MIRPIETCLGLLIALPIAAIADEPLTLETVKAPAEIRSDEPLIGEFSLPRAARWLDTAALHWQKSHACIACHTMLPYLMARPALAGILPDSGEVRQFYEQVAAGMREAMPDYTCNDISGAVAITVAAGLALNDRATTGELHALTREALDRMWTLQRPDGSWEWPFRDTPPLKLTGHFGVTLAAVAVGAAPGEYSKTTAAAQGLDGIRRYLHSTAAISLHEKAMTLWASTLVPNLLSDAAQRETVELLMAAQRPDGGWSMASLIDNTADPNLKDPVRADLAKAEPGYGSEFLVYLGQDKVYQSSLASDGYATGFCVYLARTAGISKTDPRIQRGVVWLKRHQRESGRWFTPSQSWHSMHMISNFGSAYAILALQACGEIPVR